MSDGEFSPAVKEMVDGRAFWQCEVCGEDPISEYHHRRPRGMGGSKADDTGKASNCLGVCRDCHRMIEKDGRRVAKLLGWIVGQSLHPIYMRVLYRGDYVMLGDDGSVTPC